MKRWQFAGTILAVLWIFIKGATVTSLPGEILRGVIIGGGLAYVLRNMFSGEIDSRSVVRRAPLAARYVGNFLYELVTANIDVAKRVLSPRLPIYPGVIEYPVRVRSPIAITILANSITLTPGTLTLDYDSDREVLQIHTIDARDPEAVTAPIKYWEDLLCTMIEGDRR